MKTLIIIALFLLGVGFLLNGCASVGSLQTEVVKRMELERAVDMQRVYINDLEDRVILLENPGAHGS